MNNELPTPTPRELASRASHGLDVTLVWVQKGGEDKAVVCVCDRREGAYFEIPTEPHLALAVNYHPLRLQGLQHRRLRRPSPRCVATTVDCVATCFVRGWR